MRAHRKKKLQGHVVLLAIATVILAILVLLMLHAVSAMQGNGRVVNYAGMIARGATQRLVKSELYGSWDDGEIAHLDDILLGLQTGEGSQNLTVMRDKAYQYKLGLLAGEWERVKGAIDAVREDPAGREELYALSEAYFTLADETLSAAEEYADGIARRLHTLELLIVGDIVFILRAAYPDPLRGQGQPASQQNRLCRPAHRSSQQARLRRKAGRAEWMHSLMDIADKRMYGNKAEMKRQGRFLRGCGLDGGRYGPRRDRPRQPAIPAITNDREEA